ncbi:hypothetical protein [Paenibacillus sp. NPDC057967]|uniref:hypothetical protein n=1 Tax=Paenibacillus sp. NPDC057967 TaxID=3346293 RepID=UPI0036DB8939
MRIIKKQQDFDVLRRAVSLPAALLVRVEDYFSQLRNELKDDAEDEFCLGKHFLIVVLEVADNVCDQTDSIFCTRITLGFLSAPISRRLHQIKEKETFER